jgi:mRNA guanylyltransferase
MPDDFPLPNLAKIATPTNEDLKQHILSRIHVLTGSKRANSFPGSQPISFGSEHIDSLLTEDYLVCEKSDGVRYLLFLYKIQDVPHVFFVLYLVVCNVD